MTDKELIIELNEKIKSIYKERDLVPLRGKEDSYKLNDKDILVWYGDITRHCACQFDRHINFDQLIDDLLFTSDEIIYFTAHLYFYRPYINTPLKDAYMAGQNMVYPIFTNLPGRRYEMYTGVLFEKTYNYWDRIGDLIASFYPNKFKGNIYFPTTIKKLKNKFSGNGDFDWLLNFVESEYDEFNKERIKIVHYISKSTEQHWKQLGHVTDYEKTKELHEERSSYPEYFNKMNNLCKIGFEKTMNLLEEINRRENYSCD